ncbi:cell wall metabolism sensor histidine kinase WalK [Nocardioides sp. zg-1228]|uniref:sensor histidine kinase n=1 Tax=Nocardioides sp. zg-1228 TaxID=2763008 RepID=UPI0016425988|nr:PAS domain-containing sensor histidine kinase [Nocardioides sp. zg-1228]MBC2931657.1 PAS domain S-box protein [Nocardioides sp. zg-1228]QSF57248.1 PAS domain S-box protein [Nocardioides sp. zg-1228]
MVAETTPGPTPVLATDELWRLTMEHSPVGMAIVSPAGCFTTANGALCDMLGHDADVLATMTFHELTHPDDLAVDLRLFGEALAGKISSYRITKRYVRADGSILVGDLSVALLRDSYGAPVHFIAQVADLSERHAFAERLDAAEAAADADRRTAQAVFEGVAVGLLQIDADGRYLLTNTRLREFVDLAFPGGHHGVAGQTGLAFGIDEQPLAAHEVPSARAARGEEFDDLRLWVGHDPHTRRALSVSARRVLDRSGSPAGAVLAYHDVTDQVRAMGVKDQFVSAISHELRTPLTAALAYLELLDDSTDVTPEGREQVSAARRNMLRLSHLVADLLFTTRVSAGSPLVDPYRVDLALLLAEAVDAASLHADGVGVRVECRVPETLPALVDGMRMRQVFDNLLDNAVSYSRPGGVVTVDLDVRGEHTVLTVTDEGTGIDADEVEAVFDRFYRGTNAGRLHVPGTGLGLTIVRSIVEAHGGVVSLESTPGEGTSVCALLPR